MYNVIVTNTYGCNRTSQSVSVIKRSKPNAAITAGGPTTFCSGGSVLLSANTGGSLSYQWKKGSSLISGATSSTYNATTAGNYKCVVTNAYGCSKTSNAILVTIDQPSAVITPLGPTTFCPGDSVMLQANSGAGYIYQWKKNGTNISGATAQNYTAKTSGTYKVKVTNANGCSKTSPGVSITATCREGLFEDDKPSVSIMPNPVKDFLTIRFSGKENYSVEVWNALGQKIMNYHSASPETILPVRHLPSGVYMLVLNSGAAKTVSRIIKE